MLDIAVLLWVVPGVMGLWAYNRWLSYRLPQVEGWGYLFTVVIIASPYYFIFEILLILGDTFDSPEIERLFIRFVGLLLSVLITILLARYAAYIRNTYYAEEPADPFYSCCYAWKGKLIFITLKNRKIYVAWLMDYTKDSRFESSMKISPVYSGYRDLHGKANWTYEYPIDEETQRHLKVVCVIFKREIVSFSLWNNDKAFEDSPQIKGLADTQGNPKKGEGHH